MCLCVEEPRSGPSPQVEISRRTKESPPLPGGPGPSPLSSIRQFLPAGNASFPCWFGRTGANSRDNFWPAFPMSSNFWVYGWDVVLATRQYSRLCRPLSRDRLSSGRRSGLNPGPPWWGRFLKCGYRNGRHHECRGLHVRWGRVLLWGGLRTALEKNSRPCKMNPAREARPEAISRPAPLRA